MQYLTVALALAATVTSSAITTPRDAVKNLILARQTPAGLCPGIDTPLCCQLDVDGVVDTTCESPDPVPTSTSDFEKVCSESGRTAECCTLSLDGDALICTEQ